VHPAFGAADRARAAGKGTEVVPVFDVRPTSFVIGVALRYRSKPQAKSLGANKGFFHEEFIRNVFRRKIESHIAADKRGQPYYWSQRCRKKIEDLFGEAKEFHGLRRFRRRRLYRVREETWLIGWVLDLKRLAKLLAAQPVAA
jgi:hypothetical protein